MQSSELAAQFLHSPEVDAVIEFGATARRQPDAGDVDVLIVVNDWDRHRDVVRLAKRLSQTMGVNVSPSVYTIEMLEDRLIQAPSFGDHLRHEASIQGRTPAIQHSVQSILDDVHVTPEAIESELEQLRLRLARISRDSLLAGSYGTSLGRLYAIGRAGAVLRLLAHGERDYDWRTLFSRLARRRPELRDALQTIEALRPYYDALSGRRDVGALELMKVADRHGEAVEAVSAVLNGAGGG